MLLWFRDTTIRDIYNQLNETRDTLKRDVMTIEGETYYQVARDAGVALRSGLHIPLGELYLPISYALPIEIGNEKAAACLSRTS